jgi:hypothetical protein
MHLGDIFDILSDHCGDLPFSQVSSMARSIMELHTQGVREAYGNGYDSGYESGHETGKSLVAIPTPEQWELKKAQDVYDYQMTRAQELVKNIVANIGSDRKIACIKELRTQTGLGLKDSKDIVDEHIRRLNAMYDGTAQYSDEPPF